ncbi:NAD-dependent epimerase/dehydratase family protein [bacterium]|nr:NAD-dependent epimerase/dehydratase family protein [bacterium]
MQNCVLVTGAAGFIGSHLCKQLLNSYYSVVAVDNFSTGSRANVPAGAEVVELDLTQPNFTQHLPDYHYRAICHLAGQSSGEKSFENPVYDFDANARSTLLLSEWAIAQSIPTFLYASSMGVYGRVAHYPVSEETAPAPISYYGNSKLSAERILAIANQRGLRTVSFRMFNVYGPGQNLANLKQGMVSIYLAYLLKKEPLLVKGSLERVRDFVYIDDVIRAWQIALEQPVSGIFNLGSGQAVSVRTLIDALLHACGLASDYPICEAAGTPGDQGAIAANITAIQRTLGWQPQVSLEDGLAKMYAWAQAGIGTTP